MHAYPLHEIILFFFVHHNHVSGRSITISLKGFDSSFKRAYLRNTNRVLLYSQKYMYVCMYVCMVCMYVCMVCMVCMYV